MATKSKNLITERQGKKGITYLVRIRQDGVNLNKSFKSKEEAEQFIRDIKTKIYKAETIDPVKIKSTLLKEIFESYISNNKLTKGKIYVINMLIKEIGNVELGKFKSGSFHSYIQYKLNQEIPDQPRKKKEHPLYNANKALKDGKMVKKTYSESSVRKFYYAIKNALEWHSKHNDYTFDSKPFDENKAPRAWSNQRDRILEDGELDIMIQACNHFYVKQEETKLLLKFQHWSCMRIGETLLMKWEDIKLDETNPQNSYIFVPKINQKIKAKEKAFDRKVPLRPEFFKFVKEELMQIRKPNQTLVFGHYWKSSTIVGKQVKIICKNGNIKDFTMHDMRHHSASKLMTDFNLSVVELSRITGHLELQTLNRYLKIKHSDIGAKLWK